MSGFLLVIQYHWGWSELPRNDTHTQGSLNAATVYANDSAVFVASSSVNVIM